MDLLGLATRSLGGLHDVYLHADRPRAVEVAHIELRVRAKGCVRAVHERALLRESEI